MKFTIYQESRVGKRRNNQDRLAHCYSREALLMVVADGMGGHLHGEVAAQIAVQYLTEAFQREAKPRLSDPFMFLAGGLQNAHQAVQDYALAKRLPEAESPRTTCVACIVQDSIAYWAHAGDSRLYALRDGRILTRTRDHSTVQSMIDDGQLTPAEAMHHPLRNRIYSCLGGQQNPQFDFSRKTTLQSGDVIALMSDGVWGPLEDLQITSALYGRDVMQAVPALIDEAEKSGGANCDNLSLVAMSWGENYGEETLQAIETQSLPLDGHSTQMPEFDRRSAPLPELTDEDIENAIDEIRNAIQKHSK
ncbi:MAG: protein phosphatase 2C domain-containing protein [Gammaproteobacteria bacterium]|nr:protein phosphatase 2C domain-containing protein [Gammaproteobacteria bacterium]MBU1645149.1 protein phosphatase 2C domain-containing protein [Gammaproteobacteria bacterium]MBU1973386.1 protein phosphatase 2C domain-containing protein [Gammaproteobacteria bacterium]